MATYKYVQCPKCGWKSDGRRMGDVLYPDDLQFLKALAAHCPRCGNETERGTSYQPPSLLDDIRSIFKRR